MTTQEQVKDVVSQVLADKADKGGIKRVVWIGAGGSNGGNYPAQYFMEHEATQVVGVFELYQAGRGPGHEAHHAHGGLGLYQGVRQHS